MIRTASLEADQIPAIGRLYIEQIDTAAIDRFKLVSPLTSARNQSNKALILIRFGASPT